jgi:hypothetical protein
MRRSKKGSSDTGKISSVKLGIELLGKTWAFEGNWLSIGSEG